LGKKVLEWMTVVGKKPLALRIKSVDEPREEFALP
jgi:hypothetical protein